MSGTCKSDKRVSIDPNIEILRDNEFTVIQAEDFTTRNESEMAAALKDTRRCWYVCFAAWLIQALIVGVLHVFGVFFIVLIDDFNCSKAEAGMYFKIRISLLAFGYISCYSRHIGLPPF